MQRVAGAALADAGMDLGQLDPASLRLWRSGAELPLELRGTEDGRLDPGDELRFYAPVAGDRWNDATRYWLVAGPGAGSRVAERAVAPAGAPLRDTAVETGVWRAGVRYESRQPGPDGDHWFAADMRAGLDQPAATIALPLTSALAPAARAMTLTLAGAASTSGQHSVIVAAGPGAASVAWSGSGTWEHTLALDGPAESAVLTLAAGALPDRILLDSVGWERPVHLAVDGRGASFRGVAGTWRYQLSGLEPGQELYDVGDPAAPMLLTGFADTFQDGPAPRSYLLTGAETLHRPEAFAYTPRALPDGADAIYIAPAALYGPLAPLVALRQAQGHSVAVVDVQGIYDRWSDGQVDPEAIRSFLRYAASAWAAPPCAVTLVGDGTADPHNYLGYGQQNLVPPYLAMVDPWAGETACEACYAQLDGDDPLSDPLPDLALGRLSVASAPQLAALVDKIVAYEQVTGGLDWRSRQLYLADNSYDATGQIDSAGDFAAAADAVAQLQPAGVAVSKLYYDPWLRDEAGRPLDQPWRESDAARARARAREALDTGAGVVLYFGHGHQWQWAVTDSADPDGRLLGLYDSDELANRGRPAVILAMTCLTSAFQTPAFSGTTIDERLLRAEGGAVAVWGSTGLGVAHGHGQLARGFFRALWQDPAAITLGDLTLAGFRELFTAGGCCQDTLRTYVLLGDPLTRIQARAAERVALPTVAR